MTDLNKQGELFLKAKWITRKDNPIEKELSFFKDRPNILLSKSFDWQGENQTLIAICGLGYYTAYLNGKRIGEAYLNSDVTNYNRVVYYDTYDLSPYLKRGQNHLRVELGNGWYNPAPINILGKYNVRKQLTIGKPCLICDIQLGERHIYSDETWQAGFGNLLQNDVYVGEVYSDTKWTKKSDCQTVAIAGPAGQLQPSFIPKVKRHDSIQPVLVEKQEAGWLVDFGQIISGHIAFTVAESYFGDVRLRYAEDIGVDQLLDFSSTISGHYGLTELSKGIEEKHPIIQEDRVIKTGQEAIFYSNQYTYHSFRYIWIEVCGDDFPLINLLAYRVHTAVEKITGFESSSDLLNKLWIAGSHTRLHNIHSYFEDCSRERLGYGGDTVGLLQAHLATIDARALFKKVFLDFINDQRPDGGITQTAPYVGIMTNGTSNGSGSLGWQLVLPTLAKSISVDYNDKDFVRDHQGGLEKHLKYLLTFDYDYIKYCCLGDWGSIDETSQGYSIKSPDQEFCSAVMYLLNLQVYEELSHTLRSLKKYQRDLEEGIQRTIWAIKEEFYDNDRNQFGTGSASSMIFALKVGLVDDEAAWYAELVKMIQSRDGIFPFGIFGMSWAYEELAKRGDNRLIYDWLSRTDSPSYYDMIKTGNQTLHEHFTDAETFVGSKNHAMFSSYSSWMIREVLGIKNKEEKLILSPDTSLPLDWVKGYYQHPHGKIKLEWTKEVLTVTCPRLLADKLEVKTSLETVFSYLD